MLRVFGFLGCHIAFFGEMWRQFEVNVCIIIIVIIIIIIVIIIVIIIILFSSHSVSVTLTQLRITMTEDPPSFTATERVTKGYWLKYLK